MLAIGNLDAERTTRGNTTPPFAVKSNAGGGALYISASVKHRNVSFMTTQGLHLVADRLYGVAALAASTPTVRSSGALR